MPDRSVRLALILGCAGVSGCAAPLAYAEWTRKGETAFEVTEIKTDPEGFLERHEGRRIRVQGYFHVDWLVEAYPIPGAAQDDCRGDEAQWPNFVVLDLPISGPAFEHSVNHWVVVEATVERPRDVERGGGDLVVPIGRDIQAVYLDDARLVAVDSRRICDLPRSTS